MNRIARVFPTKTVWTPDDALAFYDGPGLFPPEVDEVHVSVIFTWDLQRAEELAKQWEGIAPVKIGGPATGMRGEEFTPGQYTKHGFVITSRGCPNKCWFCSVHSREGNIRELPVTQGWCLNDDNILATSDEHFTNVVSMLKKEKKVRFQGGIEAKLLTDHHISMIKGLKIESFFVAYDTPDDLPYLKQASELVEPLKLGHAKRCYVLIGYKGDSKEKAQKRMEETIRSGWYPMAMLYRDRDGKFDTSWRKFQRTWSRPHIVFTMAKELA